MFASWIKDQANKAAGGGKSSEKNEDGLDKAIDYVQENVMGQGKQNNESAFEQAKDEQISVCSTNLIHILSCTDDLFQDFIRGKYESTTGTDMPIKDKETKLG
jgi:hypothetical protein